MLRFTKSNSRIQRFAGALAAIAALFMAVNHVQAQSTTAIISGTVTDASGAVVAGAKVDVKNVGTGITKSTNTDNQGRYRVPELIVGNYQVQASQPGFQTIVHKGITLTVGSEAVIDFSLPVGQAQQTVTVEAEASQVDTSSVAVSTLVEPTQMNNLPLNGRNFEQLLTLAPGVQTIPASGGGFYGRQENYSVAGSRPIGQAFMIDNQNFLSFFGHATGSGSAGTELGMEAISEFQTLTNTYSAQFGGNGAVVNAASKSGSNSFHGSAYEFLRNSALDARGPFDTYIKPGDTSAGPPPFRRNQFGGSLGGPIKKDKAFFFVNYEGLRAEQGQSSVTPNVPDVNAHRGYLPCAVAGAAFSCDPATNLAFVGLPASIAPIMALFPSVPASPTGLGPLTTVANNITHENYLLARVDYNLSDKDSIFARYVRDYALFLTPLNGSSLALFPEADNTANNFITVEERHIFSPTVVNLARASFSRPVETAAQDTPQVSALVFEPGQPNGRVAVAGTTIGPFMLLPYNLVPNHFIEGDDIIWTHGAHNIRAGISVERVQDNTSSPQSLGGTYTFPGVLNFLEAAPASVSTPLVGQTNSFRQLRTTFLTPYIEDEWKIAKRLTLNLGLRYEWGSDPTEKHDLLHNLDQFANGVAQGTGLVSVPNAFGNNITTKNFAPRAGFAYDPFADHKTSIRGGFGIFYDMLTGRDILPAYWLAPPFNLGTASNPAFPDPFAGTVNPPLPSLAQGLYYWLGSTPMVMQYNFNVQRELPGNMVLTVGYTGSQGRHLLLTNEFNPPSLINGAFGTPGRNGTATPNVRLNPALQNLHIRDSVGNSNYNALIVSLNHRFSSRWQTQVSYTYSKAMDNGSASQGAEGGPTAPQQIQNPYNAAEDYARSSFDRTQSLRLSTIYSIPGTGMLLGGWQISGLFSRATGAPLSLLTGFDQVGFGPMATERPNLAAGASPSPVLGGPNEYFDPTAFVLPPVGMIGNVGRDTLSGPGLVNLDAAILKDTRITKISDVFDVQFRAEFFNITNHPNWGSPVNSLFLNGVGANGTRNPAAGRITNSLGNPREIQFALKFIF
jgi:Carboxypeptidase regulatory-like domain/TonB dependent receptor-like, beta-barrel